MQRPLSLFVILTLSLSLAACDRDSSEEPAEEGGDNMEADLFDDWADQEEEVEPGEVHAIWGSWSAEEDLEALQGDWVVRDDRWQIEGTTATVEQPGAEPRQGTISMPHPGILQFTVESEDGSTTGVHHSFTRDGEALFLGLGIGGAVLEDRLVLRHGRNLIVHREGACTEHAERMFDGFDLDGEEIACEIRETPEARFFLFAETEEGLDTMVNNRIEIGDHGITDIQLRGHRLTRP